MVMKHYPPEFKAEAVALYRSRPGATIKQVAADLGVNTETLRNWIRAADGRRTGSHAAAGAGGEPSAPLEAENAALCPSPRSVDTSAMRKFDGRDT
ncbi:transposase [Streptomyces sp. NPDC090442]|uniref:transposase n=1 Tax=Streptomyces sp. NPDC090442 TaxID=3365962 RepID=UPI0037F7529E